MPHPNHMPCENVFLIPENCVLAMVDPQELMLFGVSSADRQLVIDNNVSLARAAKSFGISMIVTTIVSKACSGALWPRLQAIFPKDITIERNRMNAWDESNFVTAIERTGRKTIVFTGLWTETCIALPALQAIEAGYQVFVVEDCCGDMSLFAHENALRRMVYAGATSITARSLMLQWQYHWATVDYSETGLDIADKDCRAYNASRQSVDTRMRTEHNARLPAARLPDRTRDAAAKSHSELQMPV